ncbi:MAG: YdcF family protein [Bacteroidia bacterium]
MIIILGNKVALDGTPSPRLQVRLDKGIALYKANKAPLIIMSGGIGKEGFDEARVMAEYAIQQGVPASAIIQDSLGNNTFASAQNARVIMKAQQAHSIIIVSQYFHLLRSKIAFQKVGIEKVSTTSTDFFFEWRDLYSVPREVIGCYTYAFRDYDP